MTAIELTEEKIQEIRDTYGAQQCAGIEGPEDDDGERQMFVVRKAKPQEWLDIQHDVQDDAKAGAATNAFCALMCVFPGPKEMAAACNSWPAFATRVEEAITLITGFDSSTPVQLVEDKLLVERHGTSVRKIRGPEKPDGTRDWFVFRKPTRVEWMRAQRDLKDDTKADSANRVLCEKVCVAPGPDELHETFEQWPAFVGFAAGVVKQIAGYERAAEVKKI